VSISAEPSAPPTRGVIDAADHGGCYRHPAKGVVYPRVQVITVTDLARWEAPGTATVRSAR
jgi:hypothetical protein